MTEQNPYERLGVSEGASFDEIQAARNRLCESLKGDAEQVKKIEAAYDAVLMERLKMRQEGRIKVPDGIRFAERQVEVAANPPAANLRHPPAWLAAWLDTPSRTDIVLPGGILAGLVALVLLVPTTVQLSVILGVGTAFYFLYRKERKLGRSILLSFAGLIVGLLVGGLLVGLLAPQIPGWAIATEAFASAVMFFLLWLICSFLR